MATRKRPTLQTMTFYCPICGYKQKGYFAVCPTTGCNDFRLRQFVAGQIAKAETSVDNGFDARYTDKR